MYCATLKNLKNTEEVENQINAVSVHITFYIDVLLWNVTHTYSFNFNLGFASNVISEWVRMTILNTKTSALWVELITMCLILQEEIMVVDYIRFSFYIPLQSLHIFEKKRW